MRFLYPTEYESWWRAQAQGLMSSTAWAHVVQAMEGEVAELSDRFTVERGSRLVGAMDRPRARAAYGLFFFPQTYMRARFVMEELIGRGWRPPADRPVRIKDLGCGMGAATVAALDALHEHFAGCHVEIEGVDRSGACLREMDSFLSRHSLRWPGARWRTRVGDLLAPPSPKEPVSTLVLCCFALNEAFEKASDKGISRWIQEQMQRIDRDGALVLLEPATEECSRRLHRTRDLLVADKLARVLAPCLHQQSCPMIGSEFWCHEVRPVTTPPTLQQLNSHLHREVHLVRFSFLVLARYLASNTQERNPDQARLVAPPLPLKAAVRLTGCCGDGALRTFDVAARPTGLAPKRLAEQMARGDQITLHNCRPVPESPILLADLQSSEK